MTIARKRVLSGMQPSGLMHLGNYLGALENWKTLQDQYECYFFVADWHALSTNYADTSRIREFVREMLIARTSERSGAADPISLANAMHASPLARARARRESAHSPAADPR